METGESQTLDNPPPHPSGGTSTTSLYVGDLDCLVTEEDLTKAFHSYGPPASVRLCRREGSALCHGYVNFVSKEKAMRAMKEMNHALMKGKPMRVMLRQDDLPQKNIDAANVFVKNLDESVDGKVLEKIFSVHGTVVSCKVVIENGRSKCFGYVQFSKTEEADAAISALSGSLTAGSKKLYVAKFMKRSQRPVQLQESRCTNLYIKNLSQVFTDDLLREAFSAFGIVKSAVVMKDQVGNSRGFGFVNFTYPEDAKKAIAAMNGRKLGSKFLYVGEAQKKDERQKVLKGRQQWRRPITIIGQVSNLLVLSLERVSIDEKTLESIFSGIGRIVLVRLMHDINGMKGGLGLVWFSSSEDASKALAIFHGHAAQQHNDNNFSWPTVPTPNSELYNGHLDFLPNNPPSVVHYQQAYYMSQQQYGTELMTYELPYVPSQVNHFAVDSTRNLKGSPAPVSPQLSSQMHHPAMKERGIKSTKTYNQCSQAPGFNCGKTMTNQRNSSWRPKYNSIRASQTTK